MGYAAVQGSAAHRLRAAEPSPLNSSLLSGFVAICEFQLLVSVACGAYVFYLVGVLDAPQLPRYWAASLFGALIIVTANYFAGLYQASSMFDARGQIARIIACVTVAAVLMLVFGFLMQVSTEYSRGWAALWFFGTCVGLLSFRFLLARWLTQRADAGMFRRNTVVVGTGDASHRLLDHLRQAQARDITVRGVFSESDGDGAKDEGVGQVAGYPVLGGLDLLGAYVRDNPVSDVILAARFDQPHRMQALLDHVRMLPVNIHIAPDDLAYDIARRQPRLGFGTLAGLPMLEVARTPVKEWNAVFKRAEDIVIASAVILFFLPLMAMIAVAIKLDSPGPVLFKQKRFGFKNQPFEIWKFRTMYVDRGDATGGARTVRGDSRVTRLGGFLRRSSLDELPQIFNVLRGEMSVVGPRAHPVAMKAGDKLYHEAVENYAARHRVRPGITGLAQVSGLRGEIDTMEKARRRVEFDIEYIENFSIWLDIEILMRTIICVFKDDAY